MGDFMFLQLIMMTLRIKQLFILVSCIYLSEAAFGQKHFQVTIKLDTSLISKKVNYQYDDGKRIVFLGDSISSSGNIMINGKYFSKFATLDVIYVNKKGMLYSNSYLIDDKPAQMDLYYEPNIEQLILNKRLVNASAAYDTTTNKVYRELTNYNRKLNLEKWNFLQKHKANLNSNDSLKNIYSQLVREVSQHTLIFLKKHADDYYSFWYFKRNIAYLLRNSNPDTALLKEQLKYLQTTFPPEITQSFEGKELIKAYKRAIDPLKKNFYAPAFTLTTIDGKKLRLSDLKDKYVLFDFWASWCPPCMEEIPFVKSLRKKYPKNKLVIIGINRDKSLEKMKQTIKEKGMNWYHFFDKETDMSRLFGVLDFPTYFLVDQKGKIIYKSDDIRDDTEELTEILGKLI
ncbi:TlpA family protein disulfide reductase [Mucilaginibacter segetis]|uniref:TlpA family protein disulfide reductase n=1 Tax=Mucilaginibacter segetis TaxID=2793071 RepID=A0A934PR26_9SPHI|nr:TlpA disulfide reductase family protein [Mucilaginibacter segetis]MBK0378092.1 TlpA family protein disulfide reductase [Mucilaginibacter segetis]